MHRISLAQIEVQLIKEWLTLGDLNHNVTELFNHAKRTDRAMDCSSWKNSLKYECLHGEHTKDSCMSELALWAPSGLSLRGEWMSAHGTKPKFRGSLPSVRLPAHNRPSGLNVGSPLHSRPRSEGCRRSVHDPRRKFGLFAIPARSGPPAALDDHLDAASAVTTADGTRPCNAAQPVAWKREQPRLENRPSLG